MQIISIRQNLNISASLYIKQKHQNLLDSLIQNQRISTLKKKLLP